MSRVYNCLKMLEILSSKRVYKRGELANILETKVRNISEYRDELTNLGYHIEHKRGKYGGYYLNGDSLLSVVALNDNEKAVLSRAHDYLKSTSFLHQDILDEAMIKINASINQMRFNQITYLNTAIVNNIDLIQHYYDLVNNAIISHNKISFTYYSISSNQTKDIIVHPYELVKSQDFWYILGCDENDLEKYKYYKLSSVRISNLQILDKHFYYDPDFKISDFLGLNTILKNQSFSVEFIVYGPSSIVIAERVIGHEPQYEWQIPYQELYVKTTFEGKYLLESFILSLGSNVKVISPQWLLDSIKDHLNKASAYYI